MDNISKDKYEDIIELPHHVSEKHPQMSMEKRAAQFAPFAALTGFEETITATEQLWEQKVENEIVYEDI